MGLNKEAAQGKMVWQEFEPKPWEETDVDIKVTHCGICGSDMHTLRSGWVRSLHFELTCSIANHSPINRVPPTTLAVSDTKSSVPPFAWVPKPWVTSKLAIAWAWARRAQLA